MNKKWVIVRRGLTEPIWGLACLLLAVGFYVLDGLTITDPARVSFTWCGLLSFPLVGVLAHRIARSGKGNWSERIAVPLITWMGQLWIMTALYALPNSVIWFMLSFVFTSLLYFAVLFVVLHRQRHQFMDVTGKLTNTFYLLKTQNTMYVWVTSVISLAVGNMSFDPQLIALSFSGVPALLAVLALEIVLRYRKFERDRHVAFPAIATKWGAICLATALFSVCAIASQFRSAEEMSLYVPEHPQPWIGWLSFVFIGLLMHIALRTDARLRWLAVGFVFIWAFYGHYALNVAYSPGPESQIVTLVVILVLYCLIILACFWRARGVLVDEQGKISDFFEYLKSLVSGFGWILATMIVLIFSRMHQETMPVVLWGGIPLSVAPLMLVIFGWEGYIRWRQVSSAIQPKRNLDANAHSKRRLGSFWLWLSPLLLGLGFLSDGFAWLGGATFVIVALCVHKAYQITARFRWTYFVLGWLWSAVGIYSLAVTLAEAGVSPIIAGIVALPFYTIFYVIFSWRRRRDLLKQDGQIGEGFQYLKATTTCMTWLIGTVSFILYKVWLLHGDNISPYLIIAFPLSIAPMVSGLYFMEAWLRSRWERSNTSLTES